MIDRRALVVLALLSGAVAALGYQAATQRVDVVVASRDIGVPHPLTADDLEIRTVSAGLAPEDAVASLDAAIGLVPRAPLVRGQLMLARGLSRQMADFRSGLALIEGQRAVAIPVTAVEAIGGAVVPGARIDIVAVPVLGRAPTGRTTELLATGVLVLDVRGETGWPYAPDPAKSPTSIDRIGSVVIAISQLDEVRIADRIATSSFVLVLAAAR